MRIAADVTLNLVAPGLDRLDGQQPFRSRFGSRALSRNLAGLPWLLQLDMKALSNQNILCGDSFRRRQQAQQRSARFIDWRTVEADSGRVSMGLFVRLVNLANPGDGRGQLGRNVTKNFEIST